MRTLPLIFLLMLKVYFAGLSSAQAKYPVHCENKADCPGWVAALAQASGGVCSGFLIKKDVVATNLHCIPQELRSAGSPCKGKIFLTFPSTDRFQEMEANCDSVIDVSPPLVEGNLSTDYAILKLEHEIQREVIDIDKAGIADMTDIHLYKVDPTQSETGLYGLIRKKECKAVQNSAMNPYFKNNESPLVTISDCQIIKGNSGSALVGSDGRARGIVSAVTEVPATRIEFFKGDTNDNVRFAIGTNFSCVPLPFLGFAQTNHKDCRVDISPQAKEKITKELYTSALDIAQKALETKVNAALQKIQLAGKPLLKWTLQQTAASDQERKKGLLSHVEFKPVCLLPGLNNTAKYRDKLKETDVSIKVNLPQFNFLAGHDQYLRFKADVEDLSANYDMHFTPNHILREKGIPVEFQLKDPQGNLKDRKKLELNLCEQQSPQS